MGSGAVDSAYFLMFPGWESELRSNRWEWARQWAGAVPVVLVQPTQPRAPRGLRVVPETRFPNASVLYVKSQSRSPSDGEAVTAAGQIAGHLESAGHERPLLWTYNPRLLGAYAELPASARALHATENYFEMEGLDEEFLARYRRTAELSDLVIAVSSGVARAVAAHVEGANVAEITNGCDFDFYAGAQPDAQLRALDGPIAIYAGNINSRLDFGLLARTAGARPDLAFVFVGPVSGLEREDVHAWQHVLRHPNVSHLGPVEPARLPALYAAADLGLLPYKTTPWLVRNGFPLKALEMAASGLPVASTRFDPLVGLARAIDVTQSEEAFLAATRVTRGSLGDGERAELLEVARRNDYAAKFAHVRELVDEVAHEPTPPASLSALQAQWRSRASSRPIAAAAAYAERGRIALVGLVLLLPERFRERVPGPLKRALARFLSPA